MIPGLEAEFTPGTAISITDVYGVRMGVAICKDFDFPSLIRRYGESASMSCCVPAWDFGVDAWLQAAWPCCAASKSGFTLIRSAREGVMTITDPYGHVLAEASSGADIATLAAVVAVPRHVPTLYIRIGDAFGWFCVALVSAPDRLDHPRPQTRRAGRLERALIRRAFGA